MTQQRQLMKTGLGKARWGLHLVPAFIANIINNTKKRDVVLAIRGTDTDGNEIDWSDVLSDIQIGLAHTPSQLIKAEKAYQGIKAIAKSDFNDRYNFYLTGHSLGGGLASLLSAKHGGKPTVTFNAPGVQRSFIGGHLLDIIGRYNLSLVNKKQMLHIRASGDPVSIAAGKHMGTVEEVYVNQWGDEKNLGASRHIAQHSIHNMIGALRGRPSLYLRDLGWKFRA